ncbi:MAG: hypothetical protein H0V17_08730 [Deltaproteobacteria bacterium]|nr:hypothetical protein [Deltaproteobacteria bacterium]
MANQRSTFAKRQREQNKKDKAKAKNERLTARRDNNPGSETKGPPMGEPQVIEPTAIVPALPPPDVGVVPNAATAAPSPSPSPSQNPNPNPNQNSARPSTPAPRPTGSGSRPSNS